MSESYFQFPLALLAFRPWDEAASVIIGYSVISYMEVNDCDLDAAKTALNITGGTQANFRERCDRGRQVLRSTPDCKAVAASVRIKSSWVFRHRDDGYLTEREFKVLCAVYSGIGSNPMRAMTVPQIQRRAAGCASQELYDAWRTKGATYSPKQIRNTLDSLSDSGCFARATYGRRITYYSNKLEIAQLWEHIQRIKLPMLKRRAERAQDIEQSERIKALAREKGQLGGNSGAT